MKNKQKSISADVIQNIVEHPRLKRTPEVWTTHQELILSCIEKYVKFMQKPISPRQLSRRTFPTEMLNAVLNKDTGNLMEMHQLLQNPKYSKLWGKSYTKELRQLAQGVPGTAGTNTFVFIPYDDIPLDHGRYIMYGKTVVTYRPEKEKEDPHWTHLTMGRNRIVYPDDVSTPMVEIMTVKMHLNGVISNKGAKYCTFDIKDFYLNTPMERPEFMRMKLSELPPELVILYNLNTIADDNGTMYIKVQKGMYGLPQAGILEQQLLKQRLNKQGSVPYASHGGTNYYAKITTITKKLPGTCPPIPTRTVGLWQSNWGLSGCTVVVKTQAPPKPGGSKWNVVDGNRGRLTQAATGLA